MLDPSTLRRLSHIDADTEKISPLLFFGSKGVEIPFSKWRARSQSTSLAVRALVTAILFIVPALPSLGVVSFPHHPAIASRASSSGILPATLIIAGICLLLLPATRVRAGQKFVTTLLALASVACACVWPSTWRVLGLQTRSDGMFSALGDACFPALSVYLSLALLDPPFLSAVLASACVFAILLHDLLTSTGPFAYDWLGFAWIIVGLAASCSQVWRSDYWWRNSMLLRLGISRQETSLTSLKRRAVPLSVQGQALQSMSDEGTAGVRKKSVRRDTRGAAHSHRSCTVAVISYELPGSSGPNTLNVGNRSSSGLSGNASRLVALANSVVNVIDAACNSQGIVLCSVHSSQLTLCAGLFSEEGKNTLRRADAQSEALRKVLRVAAQQIESRGFAGVVWKCGIAHGPCVSKMQGEHLQVFHVMGNAVDMAVEAHHDSSSGWLVMSDKITAGAVLPGSLNAEIDGQRGTGEHRNKLTDKMEELHCHPLHSWLQIHEPPGWDSLPAPRYASDDPSPMQSPAHKTSTNIDVSEAASLSPPNRNEAPKRDPYDVSFLFGIKQNEYDHAAATVQNEAEHSDSSCANSASEDGDDEVPVPTAERDAEIERLARMMAKASENSAVHKQKASDTSICDATPAPVAEGDTDSQQQSSLADSKHASPCSQDNAPNSSPHHVAELSEDSSCEIESVPHKIENCATVRQDPQLEDSASEDVSASTDTPIQAKESGTSIPISPAKLPQPSSSISPPSEGSPLRSVTGRSRSRPDSADSEAGASRLPTPSAASQRRDLLADKELKASNSLPSIASRDLFAGSSPIAAVVEEEQAVEKINNTDVDDVNTNQTKPQKQATNPRSLLAARLRARNASKFGDSTPMNASSTEVHSSDSQASPARQAYARGLLARRLAAGVSAIQRQNSANSVGDTPENESASLGTTGSSGTMSPSASSIVRAARKELLDGSLSTEMNASAGSIKNRLRSRALATAANSNAISSKSDSSLLTGTQGQGPKAPAVPSSMGKSLLLRRLAGQQAARSTVSSQAWGSPRDGVDMQNQGKICDDLEEDGGGDHPAPPSESISGQQQLVLGRGRRPGHEVQAAPRRAATSPQGDDSGFMDASAAGSNLIQEEHLDELPELDLVSAALEGGGFISQQISAQQNKWASVINPQQKKSNAYSTASTRNGESKQLNPWTLQYVDNDLNGVFISLQARRNGHKARDFAAIAVAVSLAEAGVFALASPTLPHTDAIFASCTCLLALIIVVSAASVASYVGSQWSASSKGRATGASPADWAMSVGAIAWSISPSIAFFFKIADLPTWTAVALVIRSMLGVKAGWRLPWLPSVLNASCSLGVIIFLPISKLSSDSEETSDGAILAFIAVCACLVSLYSAYAWEHRVRHAFLECMRVEGGEAEEWTLTRELLPPAVLSLVSDVGTLPDMSLQNVGVVVLKLQCDIAGANDPNLAAIAQSLSMIREAIENLGGAPVAVGPTQVIALFGLQEAVNVLPATSLLKARGVGRVDSTPFEVAKTAAQAAEVAGRLSLPCGLGVHCGLAFGTGTVGLVGRRLPLYTLLGGQVEKAQRASRLAEQGIAAATRGMVGALGFDYTAEGCMYKNVGEHTLKFRMANLEGENGSHQP